MKVAGIDVDPCECGGYPLVESTVVSASITEHKAICSACKKEGPINHHVIINIGAQRAVFEWNRDRLRGKLYPPE